MYHNLPVKEDTYQRLLKLVKVKESWDETIKRILDELEASVCKTSST